MPVITALDDLPKRGRLMAIDHGTKRIGLAVSDASRSMAQPLEVIRNRNYRINFSRISSLAQSYNVSAFVVGYPLEPDGREGPRCQSVRAFVRDLERSIDLPTLYWDERYSSEQADDLLHEMNLSTAQRMEKIDAAAAAVILNSLIAYIAQQQA